MLRYLRILEEIFLSGNYMSFHVSLLAHIASFRAKRDRMTKPGPFLPVFLLLVVVIWNGRESEAFHFGGVGACEGCHTMHNTLDGMPMTERSPSAGRYLLRGQDQSSICLNCHNAADIVPTGYHVSTDESRLLAGPPVELTPGGDFAWLKRDYNWIPSAGSSAQSSPGERHGHNIVAEDFNFYADTTYLSAPGGTYPSSILSCISCHDPHGTYRRDSAGSITTTGKPIIGSGSYPKSQDPTDKFDVGVYRLLGGRNYSPKSLGGIFAFINNPPAAVAPFFYNRSEAYTQTRVAYGSGMSEWCLNCHQNINVLLIHRNPMDPNNTFKNFHPSGYTAVIDATKANNYDTYVKTGDLTGSASSAYLSLVPFEEQTSNYATLKKHALTDDSYLYGPEANISNVTCLTCHRAHASGWDGIMRWNAESQYIVFNGNYSQEGQVYQPYGQGRTEAEARRAYYDRPASKFGTNQDSLCNKCHLGTYP